MTQQPHELVWTLTTAGFAARCVHVVADLGVADRIDDSSVPAPELASACGVDADALGRVMSLLAAHGSSITGMASSDTPRPPGCCAVTTR